MLHPITHGLSPGDKRRCASEPALQTAEGTHQKQRGARSVARMGVQDTHVITPRLARDDHGWLRLARVGANGLVQRMAGQPATTASAGMRKVQVVPFPTSLSAQRRPPRSSMKRLANVSPRAIHWHLPGSTVRFPSVNSGLAGPSPARAGHAAAAQAAAVLVHSVRGSPPE